VHGVASLRLVARSGTRRGLSWASLALVVVATGAGIWAGVRTTSNPPSAAARPAPPPAQPGVSEFVLLGPEATPREVSALHRALAADPQIASYSVIDARAADEELRALLADQPQLVAAVEASGAPVFQIVVRDPGSAAVVADRVSTQPGVGRVLYPSS
jgi:hypothetical protein